MKKQIINTVSKTVKVTAATIILSAMSAFAGSNAGQSAGEFLLIGMGAQAAGMGGAYTAMSKGVSASYWNPAGLTSLEGGEVTLGHYSWYQDITVNHAAAGFSVNEKTALSVSVIYLNYGSVQGRDINGVETGDITAYDMAAGLSLARTINDNISLGVTGKYVSQKIENMGAYALAADFGASYTAERFTVAGVVANVGTDMTYQDAKEPLPSAARVGVSFLPFSNSLRTSVEVEQRFAGDMVVRNGFEFNYNGQYFLRTGYDYDVQDQDRSIASGLSFGAGVNFRAVELDYAYTMQDSQTKESLHRFSLAFQFGQK